MENTKKLSLIIVLLLLFLTTQVGFSQSGIIGDSIIWRIAENVLTIGGTGAIPNYGLIIADSSGRYTIAPWGIHRKSFTVAVIESNVISIGDLAFYGCTGLTSINVDSNNLHLSSVDGVVFNKDQTTMLLYPRGKQGAYVIPDGVISISGGAFFDHLDLTAVTIPNSVNRIGGRAFQGCTGLSSIIIPNSVTEIGWGAFLYCSGLTAITIPSSVTFIQGHSTFDGCIRLTSINVDPENPHYSSIDGVVFNKDQTKLIVYPRGRQGAYIVPDGVNSIEWEAFSRCAGLTSITFPNSVTSIKTYAFTYCTGLTSITFPSRMETIRYDAFRFCDNLTSMDVAPDNPNFSSVDGVVFNKDQTALVLYPRGRQGAYAISNCISTVEQGAFYECAGLTSVIIPNSVIAIGDYAFERCTGLTSVTIPDGVTWVGNSAFQYCFNLTSICIPNSVISIGSLAFSACTGLVSVTLSKRLISIEGNAFSGSTSLTSVISRSSTPPTVLQSFGSTLGAFFGLSNTCLYVPKKSVRTYQSVTGWSNFSCIKAR
ncbi:MAG: leucine-rich repeat domain-containing protein [Prevotellaceae bacterium]|jgi:hypothetical protein|nr:leucine-rich repeat domain-containing protein [Prevotellaceae bacterium]